MYLFERLENFIATAARKRIWLISLGVFREVCRGQSPLVNCSFRFHGINARIPGKYPTTSQWHRFLFYGLKIKAIRDQGRKYKTPNRLQACIRLSRSLYLSVSNLTLICCCIIDHTQATLFYTVSPQPRSCSTIGLNQ